MTKKKRVGTLYGHPLVEGDYNKVGKNEILVTRDNKKIGLSSRDISGKLNPLIALNKEDVININTNTYNILQIDVSPTSLESLFSGLPNCEIVFAEGGEPSYINGSYVMGTFGLPANIAVYGNMDGSYNENIGEKIIKDIFLKCFPPKIANKPFTSWLKFTPPYCWIKDGIIQFIRDDELWVTSYIGWYNNDAILEYQIYNMDTIQVDDAFGYFGKGISDNYSYNAPDEPLKGVGVSGASFFIHPLLNGIFTIGVLRENPSELLVIKCADLDFSEVRKKWGIPENRVIPSGKPGDYWHYPNQGNPVPTKNDSPISLTLQAKGNDNKYYCTYSNERDTVLISNWFDTKVYAIDIKDNNIVATELTYTFGNYSDGRGYYIPANTGVLICSTETTLECYYIIYPLDIKVSNNLLKPSPKGGGVFDANSNYIYYKLAYGNNAAKTDLGFYWGADNGGAFSVKADTAYLAVPKAKSIKNDLVFGN